MKSALEDRRKTAIPDEHPVLTWLVEHAAILLNKYEVGHDGKTAHDRLTGKKATMFGLEFGAVVLFRRKPVGDKLAKLECMWEHCIYLGHRAASVENIVGTKDSVHKTRTFHRKPQTERWKAENAAMVSGVP